MNTLSAPFVCRVGDRLLVTPLHGRRFGMVVERVYGDLNVVAGPQVRLGDGTRFQVRKVVRVGSMRSIEVVTDVTLETLRIPLDSA